MKKVRTVLGDVSSNDIGNIMMHEHVLFDISLPKENQKCSSELPITERWQIDYLSNQNPENASQQYLSISLYELNYFRSYCGNLIVYQSVLGFSRDADG